MTLPEINLEDLIRRYTRRRGVYAASHLLNTGAEAIMGGPVANYLSQPRTSLIIEKEAPLRRAFDNLLASFNIIEIASLIQFVPDPLPYEYRELALAQLRNEVFKKYYEHYCPLLLPRLLRARLEGSLSLHTPEDPLATNLFIQFLELNQMVEEDDQVEEFLTLVYRSPGSSYTVEQMLVVLESPRSFEERIEHPPAQQDELDRALHGLFTFLTFCVEFDSLLGQCLNYPLLQSAMWHYHALWFDMKLEEVKNVLTSAIDKVKDWQNYSGVQSVHIESRTESEEAIIETQKAVEKLTTGVYRSALEKLALEKLAASSVITRESSSALWPARRRIYVTVILDSGCFLPIPIRGNGNHTEIGYFASEASISDIQVRADGNEIQDSMPLKLGKKSLIEVRHVTAEGNINRQGVKGSNNFHNVLLHMKDLYDRDMLVDRNNFDAIIRFDSGLFVGSMIKLSGFRKQQKLGDGHFAYSLSDPPQVSKPIAHDVNVFFTLTEGESLELTRDGQVFWSSRLLRLSDRLEIEFIADNSTAHKFYRDALKEELDTYWIPNGEDPPPVCPGPPCQP
jgi:hypothetical protein